MTTTNDITQPQNQPTSGFAVTSLVLGCCSIVFFFWVIPPVLAIIFGGISISQSKKAGLKPSGMAVAGLTLGIIFTAVMVLFLGIVMVSE